MDHSRRHFFSRAAGLAGAAILPFANNSFAQTGYQKPEDKIRSNEHDVINRMAEAGYPNFILLNKKNTKLYIIQNGEFFLETPVIIGRSRARKSITPSGVFSLTNIFQGESQPKMMFYHDATQAYLLHEVVPGREYALKIDGTTAKKLSDGCVNVPLAGLNYILAFARQNARNNPNGWATPFVVMDEEYSKTNFTKIIQGFSPQKYNPDLY